MVPRSTESLAEARVACARMEGFLTLPEHTTPTIMPVTSRADAAAAGALAPHEIVIADCGISHTAANGCAAASSGPLHAAPGHCTEAAAMLSMEDAAFGWAIQSGAADSAAEAAGGARQQFELYGLNARVRRGEIVGICGRVASGKSSLLQGILGPPTPLSSSPRPPAGSRARPPPSWHAWSLTNSSPTLTCCVVPDGPAAVDYVSKHS